MKKYLVSFAVAVGAMIVVVALIVMTGVYNVAADDAHTSVVHSLLETARERSIAVRADAAVPDLADPQRIRRGAGNYNSMCAQCHLKPGGEETEISRGLYPSPPELAQITKADPARTFWVIKHGIKATGMPAWGRSMEDKYIWDMVAFLQHLPALSAEQYAEEVRASGGHSHGGGETTDGESESAGHSHDEGETAEAEHSHGDNGHSHDGSDDEPASHEHAPAKTQAGTGQELANAASDPIATVKAFHAAVSSASADQVKALLDPKVLIMEGGNVERSRKEYASHHLPADLKFMSSIRYQLQRQTGDTVGDLAWVASEASLTGESGGKSVDLVSTESLVLKKTASGWKIVHIHWSSRNAKKA